MEVGQLCNVVAAIAPDGPNALQLLSGLLLCYPSQAILLDTDAGDGPDLLELVQAEGLHETEHRWQRYVRVCIRGRVPHTQPLPGDSCRLCDDMSPVILE